MRETGQVRKIVNGRAHVLVKRKLAACCGSCSACSTGKDMTAEVQLDAVEGLQPGDEVILEVQTPSPLKAGLLLFLLPMIVLVGVTLLVQGLAAHPAEGSVNGAAITAGVVAMVLWYAGIYVFERRKRGDDDKQPRIVDFTHPPQAPETPAQP